MQPRGFHSHWSWPQVPAIHGIQKGIFSALMMADGRLALFYLARKSGLDMRMMMRFSTDSGTGSGKSGSWPGSSARSMRGCKLETCTLIPLSGTLQQ